MIYSRMDSKIGGIIMDKVVIFDWGGIVESHENNLQDLNEAKIRLIKRFNHVLPDEEILKR